MLIPRYKTWTLFPLLLCLSLAFSVQAQQRNSEQVGDYTIYYDVLPTRFLDPQIAQAYGVVRSQGQGLIRITVLKTLASGEQEPVVARVSGQVGNLAGQTRGLSFREVQVGQQAGYSSLATFRFAHDDPMRFNLRVSYERGAPAHELHFIRRLYMD